MGNLFYIPTASYHDTLNGMEPETPAVSPAPTTPPLEPVTEAVDTPEQSTSPGDSPTPPPATSPETVTETSSETPTEPEPPRVETPPQTTGTPRVYTDTDRAKSLSRKLAKKEAVLTALLKLAYTRQHLTVADVEKEIGLKKSTARSYLETLVERQSLRVHIDGRTRTYSLPTSSHS